MSSYNPIGGHSVTQTELKYENAHKAQTVQKIDSKTQNNKNHNTISFIFIQSGVSRVCRRIFRAECMNVYRNEPPRGKTNNVVSEQVRHKPACTVTEKS